MVWRTAAVARIRTPLKFDTGTRVTWLIHMRDVAHSHVTCVTGRIHAYIAICPWNWKVFESPMHPHVWHDSFIHVTWLTHICDVAHSCVWNDAFMYTLVHADGMTYGSSRCDWNVFELIHIRDMAASYVWRDAFMYTSVHADGMTYGSSHCNWENLGRPNSPTATWLIHMRNVWRDAFVYDLIYTQMVWNTAVAIEPRESPEIMNLSTRVTWLIDMWKVWRDVLVYTFTYTDGMTWLILSHTRMVWLGSFICETWLVHMFDVMHSYVL